MAIRDKQPDADAGRVIVDNDLESLEKKIAVSYGEAAKDITTDLDTFLAKYETKDEKKREQVASGEITEDEYIDWRKRQIFQSDAMKAKIEDLSQRMVNADKQAMAMVNNELPEVYATSYNFGGFRGETYANAAGFDYTQFTIINQDAVRTLMKEDPDLIPWKPSVNGTEDKAWNRKHIQNAVQQGIIKGDSMDKISQRLLPVVNMDKNAAIRTARTAVNGVENKGRTDATQRVVDAGIPMVQQWSCTHDNRTRFTHILIDGETISVGGYFSNGLRYPADPSGDPAEVYNCRCSAISVLEGIDHSKDDELYEKMMSEEYYDDWVKVKEDREAKEEAFQERKEKAEEWSRKQQEKALETGVAQEVAPVTEEKEKFPDYTFTPATTLEEAEERAREMGAPYTIFKGWSLERANNALEAVERLPVDCRPKAILDGKNTALITQRKLGRKASSWYGVTYDYRPYSLSTMQIGFSKTDYDGGQVVGLNVQGYKTLQQLTDQKLSVNQKYFEKNGRYWFFNTDGERTAHHEMGHCLYNGRVLGKNKDEEEWEQIAGRWAKDANCDILEKPEEAFAEAWAGIGANDKRVPDYVADFIRRLI